MNLEHTSNPNSPHFCGYPTFECACCHQWVDTDKIVEDVLNVNGKREDICDGCFEEHASCSKCGSEDYNKMQDGIIKCNDCGFNTISEDFFTFF